MYISAAVVRLAFGYLIAVVIIFVISDSDVDYEAVEWRWGGGGAGGYREQNVYFAKFVVVV